MKKLIIIMLMLSLTACINQDTNDSPITTEKNLEINATTVINPIKVGLYQDNSLIKSYHKTPTNHQDIAVFNIYYTNQEILDSSNIKYNWHKYYNQYENIDNYKIGFYISFEAENRKIEQLILNPSTKHAMGPYLYVYLYDDIHQADGTWYSHLEPADMKEDTIFSSIKLYFADYGSKISSPITLTVFTYDEDDFDEEGNYLGTSKYTITIKTN